MDYTTEVINITKIQEGFYIGDQIAASNLDVIIQFKLTHMINATGTQIINQWESIGIKYLTLNWAESPKQNLFDSKDEIANRIVSFIDDSFETGEGLLAHSVRGQDRVCIVVLIYLMKKYKWGLSKSMDFLRSKKQDVDIPKFFVSQLLLFENRLTRKEEGIKNIPWSEENLNDPEEKLLRNTYVNSLKTTPAMVKKEMIIQKEKRRIGWADINYKKSLVHVNTGSDLMFMKDIKMVTSHKRLRPSKSCVKKRSASVGMNCTSSMWEMKKNKLGLSSENTMTMNKSAVGFGNSPSIGENNIKTISSSVSVSGGNNLTGISGINILNNYGTTGALNNMNYNHLTNNYVNIPKSSSSPSYANMKPNDNYVNIENQRVITVNTNTNINNSAGVSKYNFGTTLNNYNENIRNNGPVNQNDMVFYNQYRSNNIPQSGARVGNIATATATATANSRINISNSNNIQRQHPNHFQPNPNQTVTTKANTITRSQSYSQNDSNLIKGAFNLNTANSLNPNNIKNYSIMKENMINSPQTDANKIIFANKYEHIINANINNFYINPESFQQGTQKENKQSQIGPIPHIDFASSPLDSNLSGIQNYRTSNIQPATRTDSKKIAKTTENQRVVSNNYITGGMGTTNSPMLNNFGINEKKMKVIDYSNTNPYSSNMYGNASNKNQCKLFFLFILVLSYSNQYISNSTTSIHKPLNNYNPKVNKKNMIGSSLGEKGPVKLKSDLSYSKKPSTPTPLSQSAYRKNKQPQVRPSTAPQKDKSYSSNNKVHKGNPSQKRLPSPQIQSNLLNRTQKLTTGIRQRAPTPVTKSSTLKRSSYAKMF